MIANGLLANDEENNYKVLNCDGNNTDNITLYQRRGGELIIGTVEHQTRITKLKCISTTYRILKGKGHYGSVNGFNCTGRWSDNSPIQISFSRIEEDLWRAKFKVKGLNSPVRYNNCEVTEPLPYLNPYPPIIVY